MFPISEEIKNLLHQDTCKKNIRIHFPNGERADICNDLIVKDSVSLKESLCSQNSFTFGLAESPIFECEVVGVGNIKGATIEVSCEIFCDSSVSGSEWKVDIQQYVYSIPYGTFVVDTAERQADMIHRKLTCYNKIVGSNGMVFNEWETWKSKIDMGSASLPQNVDYDPELFYLFCSQMEGDTKLWGYSLDEDGLVKEEGLESYQVSGIYNYPDIGPQQCTFIIEVSYDSYYFGESDNRYGYTVNNYHYPSKFFMNNPNRNFWVEYVNFCSGKGERYAIMNVQPGIQTTKRINRNHYSYGNKNYLYKRIDFTDFKIYPYIYPFYDVNTVLEIQIAKQIDIYTNRDLNNPIKTIKICDATMGKYYSIPSSAPHQATLDLKYDIPINFEEGSVKHIDYSDFDVNEVLNAFLEYNSAFGRFSRDGGFEYLDMKQLFNLVPATNLYPSNSLYPQGVTGGSILPQDYQSCWYEDEYRKPYGKLIVKYRALYEGEIEDFAYVLYFNGFTDSDDESKYLTYVVDNLIFQNKTFSDVEIEEWAYYFSQYLKNITYMPFKLVGRGLPYVEPGDTFEVKTRSNDSITTIVLNRTIKGEMMLVDEYSSVS